MSCKIKCHSDWRTYTLNMHYYLLGHLYMHSEDIPRVFGGDLPKKQFSK